MKKLTEARVSELENLYREHEAAKRDDRKAAVTDRIRDFLIEHVSPVAQSLTAAGAIEIIKLLL